MVGLPPLLRGWFSCPPNLTSVGTLTDCPSLLDTSVGTLAVLLLPAVGVGAITVGIGPVPAMLQASDDIESAAATHKTCQLALTPGPSPRSREMGEVCDLLESPSLLVGAGFRVRGSRFIRF